MYELKKTTKKTNKMAGKIIIKKKCPHKDFETKLELIRAFVEGLNIKVYNGDRDGREVSKNKEYSVVNPILDNFKWVHPKTENRDYGDLYVEVVGGYLFPVNIKLLSKLNDSFNNIAGAVRIASDLLYDKKLFGYKDIAKALRDKVPFTTTPKQYGMLVVNKTDSSVEACTLFNIHKDNIKANPSNGLQFKLKNKKSLKRTQRLGQIFIAENIKELINKQAEAYLILTGQKEDA